MRSSSSLPYDVVMAWLCSKAISLSRIWSRWDSSGMGRRSIDGLPKARLGGGWCGLGTITSDFSNLLFNLFLFYDS